jgi:Protein of unknown function (DUF3631)/Primase C terminal 2 (PriCT-2)
MTASPKVFRLTLFPDLFAQQKREVALSFEELRELLASPRAASKNELPMLSLQGFGNVPNAKNCLRYDANLHHSWGVAGDYDGEQLGLDEAIEKLNRAQLEAVVYPTPSYTAERPRWRVLAWYSEARPPSFHATMMGRLNGVLGGVLAAESWTLSQAFFYGRSGASFLVAGAQKEALRCLGYSDEQIRELPPAEAYGILAKEQISLSEGGPIDLEHELDLIAIGRPTRVGIVPDNIASEPHTPGRPEAGIADIRATLAAIPNDWVSWPEWNRLALATFAACGGSAEGWEAFRAWSERSAAYDRGETERMWNHIHRSPPTRSGFGSLVYWACQADRDFVLPSALARDAAREAALAKFEADHPPPAGTEPDSGQQKNDYETIARLAKLSALEYERVREDEAAKLGCRISLLDKLVEAARGNGAGHGKQGQELQLKPPEPWPHPVGGDVLLECLADFVGRHVFLPLQAAAAIAVWVLHSYVFQCFRHTPRLLFSSPQKRCGKTTALDVLALVICKALATASITTAAVFRTIEQAKPSLLIDEADTFLPDNPELRGVVNAGHKRGGQVIRCVGDDAEPRAFDVFAPLAIAAIGRLPGTIEDRSIIVPMQRTKRDERPAMLDETAEQEGGQLARQCARWAADHRALLQAARPKLPPELFNRAADNWRPLFAIAEAAGGDWSDRMKSASAALAPDADEIGGIRLLADIKAVFDGTDLDRDAPQPVDPIASELLCKRLAAIETSPWGEYGEARKPITQRQLARALRPFKIAPRTVKLKTGKTIKGYHRDAFLDAWARYLDDENVLSAGENVLSAGEGGFDPSLRNLPQDSWPFSDSDPSPTDREVMDRNALKPAELADGYGVTDKIPPSPEFDENDADGVEI